MTLPIWKWAFWMRFLHGQFGVSANSLLNDLSCVAAILVICRDISWLVVLEYINFVKMVNDYTCEVFILFRDLQGNIYGQPCHTYAQRFQL
jgi:hypothetical protein